MYHIPGVLSPQDVARFREQLEQAEWVDGRVTTGAQGAQVKNNQQVDTRSTLYAALQNEVLNAVNQHALFFAAALPRTLSTPLFNRYQNNETYGFHVDGDVMNEKFKVMMTYLEYEACVWDLNYCLQMCWGQQEIE